MCEAALVVTRKRGFDFYDFLNMTVKHVEHPTSNFGGVRLRGAVGMGSRSTALNLIVQIRAAKSVTRNLKE